MTVIGGFIALASLIGALVVLRKPVLLGIESRAGKWIGLIACGVFFLAGFKLMPDTGDQMHALSDADAQENMERQQRKASTLAYSVAKSESYTANADGKFFPGRRIHVSVATGADLEAIARKVAGSSGATTIFFWGEGQEVGVPPALYGVEYINGSKNDVLVDMRSR